MSQKLGGAYIDVRADRTRLKTDLDKAHSRVTAATKQMQNRLSSLAIRIGSVAGIVGFEEAMRKVVTVGAKFEQSMATVRGVMRATDKEFASMESIARKMGETTEWSASQAAGALQFLGMAGFEASRAVAALPGVLDLATAGGIGLGRAADIASNALTAMRLPVAELGRVNDVFVGTITRANTNMEMMAESFTYAAPVAKAFGYSIEQLSAMIGVLGNAGVQGSMAGTQLAFAFQNVEKAFKKLGVDGTGKNFIDALELIKERGLSAQEVMEIFGMRAGRAALILKDSIPEYKKFAETLNGVEGEAKKLADTMRDTVGGSFKKLQSVMESAAIDIFKEYGDGLKGSLDALTDAVGEHKDKIITFLDDIANTGRVLGDSVVPGINMVATALGGLYSAYSMFPDDIKGSAGTGLLAFLITRNFQVGMIAAALTELNQLSQELGKWNEAYDFSIQKLKKNNEEAANAFGKIWEVLSGKRDWNTGEWIDEKGVKRFKINVDELNKKLEENKKHQERVAAAGKAWVAVNEEISSGLKDTTTALVGFAEGSKEMAALDIALEDWFGDIDAANEKLHETNEELKKIAENAKKSKEIMQIDIALEDFFGDIDAENTALYEVAEKQAEAHEKVLKESEDRQRKFLDNVQDITASAFTDMWDGVGDGFSGLCDSLYDLFKQTLIQMAAKAAATKIIIPMVTQAANALGLGGLLGTGGGGGNLFGTIGGLLGGGGQGSDWSAMNAELGGGSSGGGFGMISQGAGLLSRIPGVGGIFEGLSTGIGNLTSGIGNLTSSISTKIGLGAGGLSSAMGAGGLGGLGYTMLGGTLGLPQGKYSGITASVGGTLGSMAGSALAGGIGAGATAGSVVPVVGTIIGAILGGIAGSLFGGDGNKHYYVKEKQNLSYNMGEGFTSDLEGQTIANVPDAAIMEQRGYKDYYQQAGQALSDSLQQLHTNINDQIAEYISGMPEEIQSDIMDSISNVTVDLSDEKYSIKSTHAEEDIQEILDSVNTKIWDAITPAIEKGLSASISEQLNGVNLSMFSADSGIMQLLGNESIFDQSGGDYQKAEGVSLEEYAEAANQVFIYAEQVGAALSAVKDAFAGASEPMTSYAAAMEAVTQTVDGTIADLEALGVRGDELEMLKRQGTENLTSQVDEEFTGRRGDIWETIEQSITKTEGTYDELKWALDSVNKEYDSYIDNMLDLGGTAQDVAMIEELRARALEKTKESLEGATEAEEELTDALSNGFEETTSFVMGQVQKMQDAIGSVDDFLGSMTFSDLAPVESTGMYQSEYERLLGAAGSGDQGDLNSLFSFIKSEYLPYMNAFTDGGADYKTVYDDIMGGVGGLKGGFENFSIDTADNEDDSSDKLRKTIEEELIPALQNGGDVTIKVQLDGHEIGVAVAEQMKVNPDLTGFRPPPMVE